MHIVIPVVQESRRSRIPVRESVPISFLEFDTKFRELILITRKTDDSAGQMCVHGKTIRRPPRPINVHKYIPLAYLPDKLVVDNQIDCYRGI